MNVPLSAKLLGNLPAFLVFMALGVIGVVASFTYGMGGIFSLALGLTSFSIGARARRTFVYYTAIKREWDAVAGRYRNVAPKRANWFFRNITLLAVLCGLAGTAAICFQWIELHPDAEGPLPPDVAFAGAAFLGLLPVLLFLVVLRPLYRRMRARRAQESGPKELNGRPLPSDFVTPTLPVADRSPSVAWYSAQLPEHCAKLLCLPAQSEVALDDDMEETPVSRSPALPASSGATRKERHFPGKYGTRLRYIGLALGVAFAANWSWDFYRGFQNAWERSRQETAQAVKEQAERVIAEEKRKEEEPEALALPSHTPPAPKASQALGPLVLEPVLPAAKPAADARPNGITEPYAAPNGRLEDPLEALARTEYERVKGIFPSEYRVHHILVQGPAVATELLYQITKGGRQFEEVAREYSQDTVSAERGGDLDYAALEQYPPEFAEAIRSLRKGETSASPVKTHYGWHIIRVDDIRPRTVPPFEQVKDRIIARLKENSGVR